MSHIFISYSRKDVEYARELAVALKQRDLPVWMDDRIDYGEHWPRLIDENLDKSVALVLIMSAHARESKWVTIELNRAMRKGKTIFPLLLDGDEPWIEVEATQYVDVRHRNLPPPAFFGQLQRILGAAPVYQGQAEQSAMASTAAASPAGLTSPAANTNKVVEGDSKHALSSTPVPTPPVATPRPVVQKGSTASANVKRKGVRDEDSQPRRSASLPQEAAAKPEREQRQEAAETATEDEKNTAIALTILALLACALGYFVNSWWMWGITGLLLIVCTVGIESGVGTIIGVASGAFLWLVSSGDVPSHWAMAGPALGLLTRFANRLSSN